MKALAFAALAFTFASCNCCKPAATAPAPVPAEKPAAAPASGGSAAALAAPAAPLVIVAATPATSAASPSVPAATVAIGAAPANAHAGTTANVYDEKADAKADIAAALGRATAENRRVLLQWGANWCGWCVKLHDLYGKDAKLSHELLYEYDVVYVDIGQWDKNLDLAAQYGAEFKTKGAGVPYLTVLDAKGTVLANQATGELEKGDAHDPDKVLAFLNAQQAAPWNADELLAAAQTQAAKEHKRVFLTFDAPWCHWCHELERWMATPEASALLSKEFVIRKIDVDRDTGGKELKAKYCASEMGIPWFCVIDGEGQVLGNSVFVDAKGKESNTGFPSAEEEIAAFTTMLGKVAVHLTAEDIGKLSHSLVEYREASQREAKKRAAAKSGKTAPMAAVRAN